MLPWNYGFHWTTGTVIFMGAFYTVLTIVAATVLTALWRSYRALGARKVEAIRWHSDFHELPMRDRACRHAITGEFQGRVCPNDFDCRTCEMHARFMAKHPPTPVSEPEEDVYGLSFPLDRVYHRGHTWVKSEPDGTVTVGLDDLGQRMLGAPEAIELPKPGERVTVNGTAWRATKRGATVRVLSPVEGEVVETGAPGGEWYLKIRPDKLDLRHLLSGREVKPWVMRELERLQMALAPAGATPTLADGGAPVADLSAAYPQADWDAVCGEIFLNP
jgi:hypothetical protein